MDRIELSTPDLTEESIQKLGELFPQVLTEVQDEAGEVRQAVDFDALRDLLGDVAEGQRERYQFTWPGKREAKAEARRSIDKTMRPCPEESVNWDTTENLYIEGDNLDALKILKETYAGKVKMIYIDPPYNTGHDFIYRDRFARTHGEYDGETADYNDKGERLVENLESNGRFHSDWCSMMYPRLMLARDLLTDDGVLFMSINDREHINAARLLESVFGFANFVEEYIWESTFRPDNTSSIYRKNAEYVVCYAREKNNIRRLVGDRRRSDGLPSLTKNSMKESTLSFRAGEVITYMPDGHYAAGNKGSYVLENDVEVKNGRIVSDFRLTGRVIWGQDYLEQQLVKGTEIIIKNESFVPYSKKNAEAVHSPTKLMPKDRVGDVLEANAERDELFGSKVFDYPKPSSLLIYLVSCIDDSDFVVMDFFSGSATTAHAVMKLNAEDGGDRKCILVQWPEETDEKSEAAKAGYSNICEIGKERIRRAGAKIKAEVEEANAQLKLGEEPKKVPDIGFRVLKIESSNFKDTLATPDETTQQTLLDFQDNMKDGRSDLDLLFEALPKFRIPYSARIEELVICGKRCFNVEDGQLIACFDVNVGVDAIEAIAKMQPIYAVIRDASLADDATHANFEELFKTYSPETVRRVI